jgi:excinuclease ABC subunit C
MGLMDTDWIPERAGELPREPGVYQFEAEDGRVLYVGKAVDLRDRVGSYSDPRSDRIAAMIERADTIDFAVTDTETQALLLEANLIKRQRPPYNVRLKDDKSYPLVQLTDHPVPRIEVTRDPDEGATVYGPYTDKGRVETVLKAIREIYGLRGCSDHTYSDRERPCLDYEMGICSAPCTGEISPADYTTDVESARRFFEGEIGILSDPLSRAMDQARQDQAFERAANLRDKLSAVKTLHGGSDPAVSDTDRQETTDVLGVAIEGGKAVVARLHADSGKLVERERHTLTAPDGEGTAGVYRAFISQYYAERSFPETILCAERPADEDIEAWLTSEGVELRVPHTGRESTLVDLALKNAQRREGATDEVGALADALGIDRPERIEGFDVSHTQGTQAVGSNVVAVDGSARKRDYRRKKLTDQNDDYANMFDLLRWRAERAIDNRDDRPDPDLLLIDGGKGQLQAATDALTDLGWDRPIVAVAKADERVLTPNRSYDWDDDAPQLHLLQRVRDEAHRFAVQYHQQLRDDVSTAVDEIPGVGPATRKRLLGRFGSVTNVRNASIEELCDVDGVGTTTAETIRTHLGGN